MKNYLEFYQIRADKHFQINRHELNINLIRHTHDFIELIYCIAGNGLHIIGDTEYPFEPNTLYLVDIGVSHQKNITSNIVYFDILVNKNYFSQKKEFVELINRLNQESGSAAIHIDDISAPAIENLLNILYVKQDSTLRNTDAADKILEVIIMLATRSTTSQIKNTKHANKIKPNLPNLIDYINTHFCNDIKLNSIAELYGYNPSYLSRYFKKNFDITFSEYITKLKMRSARRYLIDTNMTVLQIEAMLGYKSHQQFYKDFKKRYNTTPSKLRNDIIKKDNKENLRAL